MALCEDYDAVDKAFSRLVRVGRYEDAIALLETIPDAVAKQMCFDKLGGIAGGIVMEQIGDILVTKDRAMYERVLAGNGDHSPYAVLYMECEDPDNEDDGEIHGLERLIDFISDQHPLKKYYEQKYGFDVPT